MRVLILGGTGLLGSAVAQRLTEHGHEVVATSRGSHRNRLPNDIRQITVDRRDTERMRAIVDEIRPDAVVDGIAYTAEDGRDDLSLFTGRVGHLVMISSDFAYAPSYQRLPIGENAPLRAGTPYSEGKVDCEEVLLGQSALPVTALRPPHIIGPNGPLGSGSIQGRDRSLIDRIRRGIPVVLIEGGEYVLQPLHVDDAGDAIHAILGNDRCFGKPYNLMSRTAIPTRTYYELIASELGTDIDILSMPKNVWLAAFPEQASFTRHRIYDLSRICKDTDWEPAIEIDDAIKRTVRALIAQGDVEPYREDPNEVAIVNALNANENRLGNLLLAWQSGRLK